MNPELLRRYRGAHEFAVAAFGGEESETVTERASTVNSTTNHQQRRSERQRTMNHLLSVQDRRDTALAAVQEREAAGRSAPSFIFNGTVYSTYGAQRTFVATALELGLDAIDRAYNDADSADYRQAQRDERWAAEDEARTRPMTEAELRDVEESNERARQIAERENTDGAKLARIESILGEIRDALVKR